MEDYGQKVGLKGYYEYKKINYCRVYKVRRIINEKKLNPLLRIYGIYL